MYCIRGTSPAFALISNSVGGFDIGRAYIYAHDDSKQSCINAGDGRGDALFPSAPIPGDRLPTIIPMNAKSVMMDLIAYAKFMLVFSSQAT